MNMENLLTIFLIVRLPVLSEHNTDIQSRVCLRRSSWINTPPNICSYGTCLTSLDRLQTISVSHPNLPTFALCPELTLPRL